MRQLAYVETIKSLDPIPGADKIEKATVLGWELVVKKGEFSPGDLCVYAEVDSIFPELPAFEFLRLKVLGLPMVPIVEKSHILRNDIKYYVELSKGKSQVNPKILREGNVIRSMDDNFSFKSINPEYLLKQELANKED